MFYFTFSPCASLSLSLSLYLFAWCLHFILFPSFMCISRTRHTTSRQQDYGGHGLGSQMLEVLWSTGFGPPASDSRRLRLIGLGRPDPCVSIDKMAGRHWLYSNLGNGYIGTRSRRRRPRSLHPIPVEVNRALRHADTRIIVKKKNTDERERERERVFMQTS